MGSICSKEKRWNARCNVGKNASVDVGKMCRIIGTTQGISARIVGLYTTEEMGQIENDTVDIETKNIKQVDNKLPIVVESESIIEEENIETEHNKKVRFFTPEQLQAIINAFPNEKIESHHASSMLSLSQKLTSETPIDLTVRWALKYRVESKKSGDKHLAADIADSEILGN